MSAHGADQGGATDCTVWFGSLVRGRRDASGLTYLRNRYYDAASGRFTQQDPIGLAGGLNLYGYANGDPVNVSDPFGLCPDSVKTGDEKCPGGLSVAEWDSAESTYSCMSRGAAKRVSGLLWSGNIRGADLDPEVAGAVSARYMPGTILVNRTSKKGNWFFNAGLGRTLMHESQHVDDLSGMSGEKAAEMYERFRGVYEMMADQYEAENGECKVPT